MTNKEYFNEYRGKPVIYKGKDIGAYVAWYVEDRYVILGFDNYSGRILEFTCRVQKNTLRSI